MVDHGFACADLGSRRETIGAITSFDRRSKSRKITVIAIGITHEERVWDWRSLAKIYSELHKWLARHSHQSNLVVDQYCHDRARNGRNERPTIVPRRARINLLFEGRQNLLSVPSQTEVHRVQ